jgi:cytosine/adenosine deaminase-related metal-dependent hydrolase
MASLFIGGGRLLLSELAEANVLIEDGVITAVGPDVRPSEGAESLDASGTALMPGLVNAHFHSGENFNPGLYENLPLDLWFVHSHQVTRTEPLSPEGIYARTLLGATMMLRTGTTSVVDFLFEAPEITLATLEPVVQAYRDAGMRATILLGVADKPFAASLPLERQNGAGGEAPPPTLESIMALARSSIEHFHEPGGLIGIGLGPSAPQRCTTELFEATLKLARERGLVWQTHVLETKSQAYTSRHWHGHSFIEDLAARKLLGPDSTLVHTVWLGDRDIELMAAARTPAVHCLVSNLRLGDGIARLSALRDAGIRVALGTDGRGCHETLDMLELAKTTALVHKARGGDFRTWPTAREALAMCTSAASTCMGHGERLGRLEPGALGDVILLRLDAPALTPLNDPVRQVVYGSNGNLVDSVVVNGRVVVHRGVVAGVDQRDLAKQAERWSEEALAGERPDDAEALEAMVERMYLDIEATQLDVDSYLPG